MNHNELNTLIEYLHASIELLEEHRNHLVNPNQLKYVNEQSATTGEVHLRTDKTFGWNLLRKWSKDNNYGLMSNSYPVSAWLEVYDVDLSELFM